VPDHDGIIIGAGHNGLTAASLLARAGVDVLCIEKNRYVGGMASTVELFDGYHFEIAGSVVFPIAPYVVADLELENCGLQPIPREIMAGSAGGHRTPIEDLYLCGASCHPGPGVTFLPGYNGAHVVLDDLGIAAR
jgi:phytoene dehydrogenase-like protein